MNPIDSDCLKGLELEENGILLQLDCLTAIDNWILDRLFDLVSIL